MADNDLYMVYHGLLLPKIVHSEESLKYLENFQVKDDDVFAVTYPKSGTTWMQEILPPLLNGGDLTSVETIPNWDRAPWLEETRAALVLDKLPSPRAIVSHMHYHLMPPSFFKSKAKVIYVTRNPKDVIVSSFHFHQMASFLEDPGTFEEFTDKFLSGKGTTWMQEILPPLLNGGDLTSVETVPNWDRAPWLEETRAPLVLDKLPSPRAIVSHMQYQLMPSSFFKSKAKVIYVTRNPKDVIVSSFHFHQMASFLEDPGTFEEFTDKFLSGKVLFGKWTDHVKSWRKPELGDRIMYITYEEMVQDLHDALSRILKFLGRELSAEALDRVVDHCTFKNMKTNKMSNYSLVPQDIMDNMKSPFLRKGVAGDWKNHFSPELDAKFTAVIQEEMKGSNIRFPWE
ncbi:sulfotransferase family cytosolic 2B member 1-like protein [Labeo rohita]|uniref:Sulfotransferase n=1 Tax=Labeo rohita TaxID=84645 RepID=A0A498L4B2_LABRO|nr:sulfotransferase family cytosolic 2B member 1-like protein [Labeo rohita]